MNRNLIYGIHPVIEALNSDYFFNFVLISDKVENKQIKKIIEICKNNNIPVKKSNHLSLSKLCKDKNHQGIVAEISSVNYVSIEKLFEKEKYSKNRAFVVIANEINDPHNLGAIIRTAVATGADGIIIPKRRGVQVNETVFKVSSGAASYISISRVSNVNSAIELLKKKGFWVFGADIKGQSVFKTDFNCNVALVLGNEQKGLQNLVKKSCDYLVKVPMLYEIDSLNVSVAFGVLSYQIAASRGEV